ncbi:MAG: NADH-quinone oxidoreductase subunit NuoF [Chloroflexi bacterium]|nr:NADH-quinone oxidoreductase subunit NuoF [Chloroflexota bacterium]
MTFDEILQRTASDWAALQSKIRILIGTATCGRAAGALDVARAFEKELARQSSDAVVIRVGCMGLCYAEPLVVIIKPGELNICYGNVKPDMVPRLVEGYVLGDDPCLEMALGTFEVGAGGYPVVPELPRFETETRVIMRHCGYIDPENIGHYIANGGYRSLARALQMSPEEIIGEIKKSGLRGRGGAGFPAGKKWELCRNARGEPKYVICNADEGDPGAFVDRALLESDPHSVLEGMIIAGHTMSTPHGYIYVRAEYPLAVERTRIALKQAGELGLLGNNILGSRFAFGIEVVRAAGAFVCGESTALMYSIEGRRGMPRARPPHSVEAGLWGKPTLLNNVKTFACVPVIIGRGADWFAGIGTAGSKGTAVFALAGKVAHTGLVEVPMGTTLRQLVHDVGGGVSGKKPFKAVQIGGPSGGCLPEALIDTPVDFDSLREAGSMMGSGGMIVLDEDNCMVDAALYFLDFIQKESCGKCTMCRIGTKHVQDMLSDIAGGKAKLEDLDLLVQLAEDIKAGSLCGLGRTAANPVLTTLRYFRQEYEAHIVEHRCPALVCKDLIAYYILRDKCDRGCEHCVLTCPAEAIVSDEKRIKVIDQTKCTKCGNCLEVCPPEYSAVVKLSPISLVPQTAEQGGRAS